MKTHKIEWSLVAAFEISHGRHHPRNCVFKFNLTHINPITMAG